MNTLELNDENGNRVKINVLNIIDSDEYKKSFIIYNIEGNNEKIYASILDEGEFSYTLQTITNESELNYVSFEIKKLFEEMDEEDIL